MLDTRAHYICCIFWVQIFKSVTMSTRIKELQAKLRKQKGGDQIAIGMKLGSANFLTNSRRVRSKTVGENSLLNTLIMNKPVIANRRRHKSCQLTVFYI